MEDCISASKWYRCVPAVLEKHGFSRSEREAPACSPRPMPGAPASCVLRLMRYLAVKDQGFIEATPSRRLCTKPVSLLGSKEGLA